MHGARGRVRGAFEVSQGAVNPKRATRLIGSGTFFWGKKALFLFCKNDELVEVATL